MEALTELIDLISQNPTQFSDKLAWVLSRCPSPGSRVSRAHLNAILAVARFVSKSSVPPDHNAVTTMIEFLRNVPASFDALFWPQGYGKESVRSFYVEFLGYVVKGCELWGELRDSVVEVMGDVVMAAVSENGDGNGNGAFLSALSKNFPIVLVSDGEKLVGFLVELVSGLVPVPASPREKFGLGLHSGTSSSQSSPLNSSHYLGSNGVGMSPRNEGSQMSSSSGSRITDDATSGSSSRVVGGMTNGSSVTGLSLGMGDGVGGVIRHHVALFEEETVEGLEKQQVAFSLIANVLEKVKIDPKLAEQVRSLAKRQLQSLSAFL